MKIAATLKTACLLALTVALTSPLAASKKEVDEMMGQGGLQKVSVKGLDLAYAKPGATLAAYKRVQLDPVDVQFDKSWDPVRTGSRIKLSSDEKERIRAGVAKLVQDEFAKALQKNSTYQIASETGADVLRVKVMIVNLYLNAPDAGSVGRSKTYVRSAGEMTLMAELNDSASGQLLARVADRRESNGAGRMQLADSMYNADEAQKIAAAWASTLRKALDKAHGIGS